MSDLLGDPHAAETRIAPLHLDDDRDEFRGRTFGTGFAAMRRRGKEQPVFPIHQGLVELAGRSSPGLSHEQFVKALERWAEAGMLCPAN